MARNRPKDKAPELSRDAVLRFVADNPGRATKRDIAKAFGVKGDDRVALKDILAELQSEGLLGGTRKRFVRPGGLPPVAVLEIRRRDADGGLIAEPADWDEEEQGERPQLPVRQEAGKGPAAGLGERILAHIDEAEDGTRSARVIRVLQKSNKLVLGVFRAAQHGGGRIEPVERKQTEVLIRPGDENGAKDGDLVEVDTCRSDGSSRWSPPGAPSGRSRPSRCMFMASRMSSPRPFSRKPKPLAPANSRRSGRIGALSLSSRSIRPTPRITMTRSMPLPIRTKPIPAG